MNKICVFEKIGSIIAPVPHSLRLEGILVADLRKEALFFGNLLEAFHGLDDPDELTRRICADILTAFIEAGVVERRDLFGVLPAAVPVRSGHVKDAELTRWRTKSLGVLRSLGLLRRDQIEPLRAVLGPALEGDTPSIEVRRDMRERFLEFVQPAGIAQVIDGTARALEHPHALVRRRAASFRALLVKAGVVAPETLTGLGEEKRAEIWTVLRANLKGLSSISLVRAYAHVLEICARVRFFRFEQADVLELLHHRLLDLVSCLQAPPSRGLFYTLLAEIVPRERSVAAVTGSLEHDFCDLMARAIAKATDFDLAAALALDLGALIARLRSRGQSIPASVARALHLLGIELWDGGDSYSPAPYITRAWLSRPAPIRFATRTPFEREDSPTAWPLVGSKELQAEVHRFFHGAPPEFVHLSGRTLSFERDGECLSLKFLRQDVVGDSHWNESRETLLNEVMLFGYLNRLRKTGRLIGRYPESIRVHGASVLRVRKSELAASLQIPLLRSQVQSWPAEYLSCFAYRAPADYHRYLFEAEEHEAQAASRANLHDLFALASLGIIHPDIIELFHDLIRDDRPDHGHWIWIADLMDAMPGRHGVGRLHAWDEATAHPNMRVSGPADFAEMGAFPDVMARMEERTLFRHKRYKRLLFETRARYVLALHLGNYLLAWLLNEAKRLVRSGRLDWRDTAMLEESIRAAFSLCYRTFTGTDRDEPVSLIDFRRLARQTAFFLGGAYRDYHNRELPEEIFGIRGLRFTRGDGWGFIHRSVLYGRLGATERESLVSRYFVRAISPAQRAISPDVLQFAGDFKERLQDNVDCSTRETLLALYEEYGRSCRFDGLHEDLGMVNGPFWLQELIKALYVYVAVMIDGVSLPGGEAARRHEFFDDRGNG